MLSLDNRPEASDVVIVVTDGHTNNWNRDVLPVLTALKTAGTTILPVGLTNSVNGAEMRQLATNPADAILVFEVADLATEAPRLANLACLPRTVPGNRSCQNGIQNENGRVF